ncbi:MAG: TIGR01212 family radical SAM protein [Clostridiales bacterium]|nr:TIGR01212 family radical SAM protein [Clostridiales bacterium]
MKYLSANEQYKQRFGRKMYKASVSLDVTCPNRDGKKGYGGCIFCSAGGSGEFSSSASKCITDQINDAIALVSRKAGKDAGYIAYFQSFTNTYCPADHLRCALEEAADHPDVYALSVATRPDCLPDEMISMLSEMNEKIPVYIELGLQTSSDETGELINRCYRTEEFRDAVSRLRDKGIYTIAHVICGLPGEGEKEFLDTVRYAAHSGVDGIKFTCLYVLRGTKLEEMYDRGQISLLSMEGYFDIIEKALAVIPENVAVHRLTGDGPKKLLIAPMWTADKRRVINYINRRFG